MLKTEIESLEQKYLTTFLRNSLNRVRYGLKSLTAGLNLPLRYVSSPPSPQNALDIFKGEWWSHLPEPFADLQAGDLEIFRDARLTWALEQIGGLQGQTVLELGPLEGAHTYMLERAGAASVIAVEANTRAYLKCLIVKEILGMPRSDFICGDFVEYLRNSPPRFSVAFASGVLYHMIEPVELIARLSKVTDRLFLWTHYYDAHAVSQNRQLRRRFTAEMHRDYAGFHHRLFRYQYWGSFGIRRFCGGSRPHAHWMLREEILACLKHFGFTTIKTSFETPDHPDGPAVALVALRT